MKRMVIERYVPPAPSAQNDGLAPMPALPAADGKLAIRFIGRRSYIDGFGSETVIGFARTYARTCCATLDVEIDVLKAERDALRNRLLEVTGGTT